MSVRLEVLKASYGDCIVVTIINGEDLFTILIDGGTANTYSHKGKKKRIENGPLKDKIEELKSKGIAIDLLIITHVDDDHIGGIKQWFESDLPTVDFVKRIWMNDDVEITVNKELDNNSAQAASLKTTMQSQGVSFENQIAKGCEVSFDWGRIIVLAPTAAQHNRIAQDIKAELDNAVDNRYDVNIKTLLEEKYVCGAVTPENDASIAFLLQTNEGINYLFLGDANIDTVLGSIKNLKGFDKPIHCKWVKLSHHGSKNNFKPDLFDLVVADNFIISTDGTRHGHPDKEVVAWLVDKTKANIWFNYPERANQIFSKQDKEDYPDLVDRIKSF